MLLSAAALGVLATLWVGSDHLRAQSCTRGPLAVTNTVAVNAGICEEELRRVAPELAQSTIDDFLGSAAGANPSDAYDMIVETRLTRDEFVDAWTRVQWAQRSGAVEPLDAFNRYSVDYRVFQGPDDRDTRSGDVNYYTRIFRVVSVAPGEASIAWLGKVDRTRSERLDYPTLTFKEHPSGGLWKTYDTAEKSENGVTWDRAQPEGVLYALCQTRNDAGERWYRTRIGWVADADVTLDGDDAPAVPCWPDDHATSVAGS